MKLEQILLAISNTNDNDLTIAGLEAAKDNWSTFYPELERLMDQFIVRISNYCKPVHIS